MRMASGILVAATAAVLLSACSTPAIYAPKAGPGSTGFADEQIAGNRWRVTFTGNSITKREAVEDYLILRAAEVTVKAGYHWFAFDARDTTSKTKVSGGDPWPRDPFWYPWYRRHPWFSHWDNGFDMPIRVSTSFEAYAEVIFLTDEQAKADPHAIPAQEVIDRIGPKAPRLAPQP